MARQSFISNLGGYALKKLGLTVNGTRTEYDTTEPKEVEITSAPKYLMWDANGNNTSQWVTVGYGGEVTAKIPLNLSQMPGLTQLRSNLTEGDPEAFQSSPNSAWLFLKKGLWRYTMLLDLAVDTTGTGITDMVLYTWLQDHNGYPVVRPTHAPINNGLQNDYTRLLTGTVYVDKDPVYRNGEIVEYCALRFGVSVEHGTDAVFKLRQSSLMLEQLKV